MSKLLSLSDLVKLLGEPGHRINFAIKQHGPEPAHRVGMTRIWTPEQVPDIQEALRRTCEHSTLADRRAHATSKVGS